MKRHYTWQTFEMDVETIKDWIRKNKVSFDAVFAPSRGGLTLGTKLSHELNIPLGIIEYQSRINPEDIKEPRIAINPFEKLFKIPYISDRNNRFPKQLELLIVDEIVDSGLTFKMIDELFKDNPRVNCTFVSIYGKQLDIKHTYEKYWYVRELIQGDWIYFPWEKKTENTCLKCINSEDCNKYGSNFIHCKVKNQSLNKNDYCREYFLPR